MRTLLIEDDAGLGSAVRDHLATMTYDRLLLDGQGDRFEARVRLPV